MHALQQQRQHHHHHHHANPAWRRRAQLARLLALPALLLLLLLLLAAASLSFESARRTVSARLQFATLRPYGLCVPRYTLRHRRYDLRQRALQLHHLQRSLNITLPFTTVSAMRRAAPGPSPAPHPDTTRAPANGTSRAPPSMRQQHIGIVSLHSQGHLAALYRSFANLTIASLQRYASRHGYPFHYNTSHLLYNDARDAESAFWGKVVLVKLFLPRFDWLLWTDLDVLILEQHLPLQTFTSPVPPQYHVVAVLECGRRDPEVTKSTITSGFFLIRRSTEALELVNAWLNLLPLYKYSPTPEQDAFVELFNDPAWRPWFYVYPSFLLSCYSECYDPGVFSVHFANTQRKECIPQWVQRLELPGGQVGGLAKQP